MAGADGTRFAPSPIMRSHRVLVPVLVAGVLLASVPARGDEPTLEAIPHLGEGEHFTIDPVVDGLLTVGGATFAELLSLILSTGEIKPTQPGSSDVLLSIDRVAVTQTIDPNAAMRSNVGLYAAYAYAVLDPILSGVRDGRRAAARRRHHVRRIDRDYPGVHQRHEDRRAASPPDRLRELWRGRHGGRVR